jgi:hypothetical protein
MLAVYEAYFRKRVNLDDSAPEHSYNDTMAEGEKIVQINIAEEMKSAYIDYSMSVIVSRALPDARDGLKPVHQTGALWYARLGRTVQSSLQEKCENRWRGAG